MIPITHHSLRTQWASGVLIITFAAFWIAALHPARADDSMLPAVGNEARDFELSDLQGKTQKLSRFTEDGPVVLMVLRGYPGYQCPICSRQVGQYITAADKLRAAKATVLMVYPGPSDGLQARAKEFITGKTLPENFHLLIDPDYSFTDTWQLRWDAPRETAYPSTFVIDSAGKIQYAKISKTHGDRAPVDDVLKAIASLKASASRGSDKESSEAADALDRVRQHTFHPLDDGFTKDATLGRHGIAVLANDDWRVRTLAVRDLVRTGAAAIPLLVSGLQDENLHVRQVSALTLGILPPDNAAAALESDWRQGLRERLQHDPEPVVRSEAAIALGRLGDQHSQAVLQHAAEKDASRDVRHQCALALDRIGDAVADTSLFEAYQMLDETSFNLVTVGKPAPDFTLVDTKGRPWKPSDHLGKKTIVLIWIFADWCPVCHGEFRELIEMKQDFADSDVEVATIQCHEPYRCRVMTGQEATPQHRLGRRTPQSGYRNALWWPHLSDPAGAVAATYGVSPLAFAVHSEYINRPGTIIIDRDGIVRFSYYGTYWGDRPSIRQTLEMVRSGEFDFEHPKRLHEDP